MLPNDLLKRFLENKCTAEEAEFVADYLKTHPEALEQLLPEAEWEQTLHAHGQARRRPSYHPAPWIYKAAAIVLLSLGIIVLLHERQQERKKTLSQSKEITTIIHRDMRENRGDKVLSFTLEDGSDIQLEPNSKIEFPLDFKADRTVTLSGMARFDVVNDPEHPFTVWAKGVETTVLGTRFEITAYPKQDQVSVRLLTGKISVRNKNQPKRTILLPGQQYISSAKGEHLSNFLQKEPKKVSSLQANTNLHVIRRGDSLLFNKQPLSYVFTVLSEEFEAPIDFNKKAVYKKFFTGYVVKSRPLEKELSKIVLMNKLLLERDTTNHQLLIK
ncbi:FecR domain-containing protein [Olivibacter sp. CPCC 100613]|uniref:FecR family protein n=1 Tax=Olivibacter sp. CPCC 100613 TaxID=3079931 RepID=UPI002FF80824